LGKPTPGYSNKLEIHQSPTKAFCGKKNVRFAKFAANTGFRIRDNVCIRRSQILQEVCKKIAMVRPVCAAWSQGTAEFAGIGRAGRSAQKTAFNTVVRATAEKKKLLETPRGGSSVETLD